MSASTPKAPNRNTLFLKIAIQNGMIDAAAGDRILATIAQRQEIGVEKKAWEAAVELELMTAENAEKVRQAVERNTPPEQVGGFTLEAAIGRGAVGTVYRAKQISLDKVVAVKLLHPNHTAEERFVSDFLREAKAVAKLNHPNIVHAIDAGESDGRYYFAMEYVEGETLRQKLARNGKLTPSETLGVAEQVAAGLSHAHGNGLLHRDLKPDNILIGNEGRTRIADLGLAVPVDDADLLAAEHKKQGTPFYLSPEAAQSKDLDARSDLYSFGALLYHCLAGKPVFTGQSVKEILTKQVHQDPVPVGEASGTPSSLDKIVMKLLAKDPGDRYGSADEVILALEAAEKSIDGTAPRPPAPGGAPRARGKTAKPRTPTPRTAGRPAPGTGGGKPAGRPAAGRAGGGGGAPVSRSTYQRKSKTVSMSGLGVGVLLAALVAVSQLTGAKSPETVDQIQSAELTAEQERVRQLKIEKRIERYEQRFTSMEAAAKQSLDSASEIADVSFRRRSLENWLYNHCITTQAIPMMDLLDEIRAEARAARIEGPMEFLTRAKAVAEEGRLSAAIEILDDRPRTARKDEEMNEQIEEYLSELEEEIARKEESDLADANSRLGKKDYKGALAALDRIEVYGDKKALEKAGELRTQIVKEQAEFERTERDRALRGERSEYAGILGTYRTAALERRFNDAISAAIELQSRCSSEEVRGRIEMDLTAFGLLDKFGKDALAELAARGERGESVTVEMKPVGEARRGKKYTGTVDRVEGDDLFIEVDNAVFPLNISKFTDQTVFDLVMEHHGEESPAYLVPLGILFLYRGNDDIASTHFDLAAAAGTDPDTWREHMRYLRDLPK